MLPTTNQIDLMSEDELLEFIHQQEIEVHKLDKKQLAIKLLSNSVYGALATKYFRHFSVICAESITLTGQTVTAESFTMFNKYLNKVLKTKDVDYIAFSDTDSAAVNFTPFVLQYMNDDTEEQRIEKLTKLVDGFFNEMLSKTFDKFSKELNSVENKIVMKREKIARAIIVAKKNYVVDIFDNEGVKYAEPKLTVTGMESIKASTPVTFQIALEKGYKHCLYDNQSTFQAFVESTRKSLESIPLEDLYGTTTVNNLNSYIGHDGTPITGTPGHVVGAIAYNNLVKDSIRYVPVKSGDKVNMVNLVEPNPLHVKTLAFPGDYPSELLSEEYIDRSRVFEKYFIKPIQRVANVVGYSTEKSAELDLF